MINSMTGFGSAEGASGNTRIAVEVRSVNHRFFNPSLKLPSALLYLEGELREILRTRVGRGHVTLTVRTETDLSSVAGINEERFESALAALRALQVKHGIPDNPDLATILRIPGVLGNSAETIELNQDEVKRVVLTAVDALEQMRVTEGAKLTAFLRDHLDVIENALARVAARAPARLEEQRGRLQRSVQELLGQVSADETRVAQEIAILADKLDITEELNRFAAHIDASRKTLSSPDAEGVGKRLGFILQEMLRETNTIGSKANDAAILAEIVSIKEELERLREQVENVA
ncbi:MAG: YicC family protein [Gemmatimonadaceae bacterium]|nr:YicC family protein [Gemmatimonadaceae bacterium]